MSQYPHNIETWQPNPWERLQSELDWVCQTLPELSGMLWVVLNDAKVARVQFNACYAFVAQFSQHGMGRQGPDWDTSWLSELSANWENVADRVRRRLETPLTNCLGGFGHLGAAIVQGQLKGWIALHASREPGCSHPETPHPWHVNEPAYYRHAQPESPRQRRQRPR